MEHDPTLQIPRAGALDDAASLGRQLLRQRMFPAETGGTTIGRHVVLRFIGAGGMGQVFAAYDPELDRKVALKLLPAEFSHDLEQKTRLLREAQALAKLDHPNVVSIHEVGQHQGRVYISLEFVEGKTLGEWVAGGERGRPSASAILDKYIQAGRGLAAAHKAGLVHRDFKPSNVLIDASGRARVLDFGLVAEVGGVSPVGRGHDHDERLAALDVELTTTGTMIGTPAYMAPEQFSGALVDARADQFGFCVALFEALTGTRPFAGTTVPELMDHVRDGVRDPAAPRGLSPRVARALDRGLQTNPDQRWASMEELLAALEPPSRARLVGAIAAVAIPVLGVVGWQVVAGYEQELDDTVAALSDEVERADRLAFEREVIDEARRAAEVGNLARSPGRELDAIALGVEILAEYGPDRADAAAPAVQGLATALAGLVGVATLDRPDRPIASAVLSNDGSLLVTTPAQPASGAGELEIWSTDPARKLRTIALGELDVAHRAPSISSDNRTIAVASERACEVFDVDAGERMQQIADCTDPAFTVDGQMLIGKVPCSEGPQERHRCGIAAWSLQSGQPKWSMPMSGHEFAFLVHPDGERLIVRHDRTLDESIDVISTSTGELSHRLVREGAREKYPKEPTFSAEQIALSEHGRTLVAVETDGEGRLVVWDLDTLTPKVLGVRRSTFGWMGVRLLLSRSGNDVLIQRPGGNLAVWDTRADQPEYLQSWGGSRGVALPFGWLAISSGQWLELPFQNSRQAAPPVENLLASTDGRFVVSVAGAGSRLWSTEDHFALDRWSAPAGETIRGFTSTQIVTHTPRGVFRVYRREGEQVATLVDSDHLDMFPLTLARERPTRVVFRVGQHLEVHEVGSAQPLCRIPASTNWGISVDGQRFAVLEGDRHIRVWDVESCVQRETFELPEGKYMTMRFAADGSLSIRTPLGRTIIRDGQGREFRIDERCTGDGEGGYSRLSPDGRLLLTCCNGMIPEHNPGRLWDVHSGELIREYDLRGYSMEGQISHDGKWLLFNVGISEIAILSVADGRELFRLPGRISFFGLERTRGEEDLVLELVDPHKPVLLTLPLSVPGLVDAACRVLDRSDLSGLVSTRRRCRTRPRSRHRGHRSPASARRRP